MRPENHEVRVETWPDLMSTLYQQDFDPALHRHRSAYVYRGLNDPEFDLTTSLSRQGSTSLERHLLRNFKKYSELRDPPASEWNWLALAQHHGLPTRLLDWTYSPLVALHFATAEHNKFDRDSVIWALDYHAARDFLPERLALVLKREGSHILTAELIDEVASNFETLRGLSNDPFPIFLEPPSLDSRIVNQYAVFSMMSDPEVRLDEWVERAGLPYFRVVIAKELLWQARDRLDQANINERVLFPGLDGLAAWLRRHYHDIRPGSAG